MTDLPKAPTVEPYGSTNEFWRFLLRSPLLVRAWTAIALALLAAVAHAQEPYPAHAVRIIVSFPPGGPADARARLAGDCLARSLGQAFVIENRPGAGGNIGMTIARRATHAIDRRRTRTRESFFRPSLSPPTGSLSCKSRCTAC